MLVFLVHFNRMLLETHDNAQRTSGCSKNIYIKNYVKLVACGLIKPLAMTFCILHGLDKLFVWQSNLCVSKTALLCFLDVKYFGILRIITCYPISHLRVPFPLWDLGCHSLNDGNWRFCNCCCYPSRNCAFSPSFDYSFSGFYLQVFDSDA